MSIRRIVYLAVCSSVGTACGSAAESNPEVTPVIETGVQQNALFFQDGVTLWNGATTSNTGPLGSSAAIPVCWIQAPRTSSPDDEAKCDFATSTKDCLGTSFASTSGTFTGTATTVRNALRNFVREAIERSWMSVANVEFYGWNACPISNGKHQQADLNGYLAIQFSSVAAGGQACTVANDTCGYQQHCDEDTNQCTSDAVDWSGLGKPSGGPTVMQLNWKAINDPNSSNNRFNIVHEFGHALGFSHEWTRQDWTLPESDDFSDDGNVAGNYLGTPANDTLSIMDYSDDTSTLELSAWDIIGVQKAYGRKYSGSLVGDLGHCANIEAASVAAGAHIISYPCRGQWNDTFNRVAGSYHFQTPSNQRCLNIAGAVGANPLLSWDCTNTTNEDFVFSGVEWRGMGKMCVHRNGSLLELRDCNGSSAQKWDFFSDDGATGWQIRANGSNTCVQSPSTSGALGEQLTMATCNATSSRQRFNFPGAGRVRYGNNAQMCLNTSGGVAVSGSPIIFWNDCGSNPGYNSRFQLHGQVKARTDNYCMEAMGRGVQAEMRACSSGNLRQVWDYYL